VYTYTIIHRRTREALHSVVLPATRDTRKGKADAIAAWRAANKDYRTPLTVLITANN